MTVYGISLHISDLVVLRRKAYARSAAGESVSSLQGSKLEERGRFFLENIGLTKEKDSFGR